MDIKINKKKASLMWGGIHNGYIVSKTEIEMCKNNGDTYISVIPLSNGYYEIC